MARTANEGAWCGLSASIRDANNRLVFMHGMSAVHGGVAPRCRQPAGVFSPQRGVQRASAEQIKSVYMNADLGIRTLN